MTCKEKLYDPEPLFELELARYRLSFSTKVTMDIKELAPLIRSRLGYILKERFCPFHNFKTIICKECSKTSGCLYIKLFAPTLDSIEVQFQGKGRTHATPPRPFCLDTLVENSHGVMIDREMGQVELTLIGRDAIQYQRPMLESIFHAVESIRISHLSCDSDIDIVNPVTPHFWERIIPAANNGALQLEIRGEDFIAVNCTGHTIAEWIKAMPLPEIRTGNNSLSMLDIKFCTPVQLGRIQGRITFTAFLQSVLSRLRDLKRIYHPDNDMGNFPKKFYEKSDLVAAFTNLKTIKLTWYSHAQKTKINIGGLMGNVIFKGDIEPFLPLVAAGTLTGIGKKSVYGLGHFEIVYPSCE